MRPALKLGSKVRTLRRQQQLTQVELAGKLAISPSYLNLIEHNQRPLTAPLLLRLAQIFSLDLTSFAEDNESRIAADLQEIFADPLFEEHPLTVADIREMAGNSAASRAVLALYQAYQSSLESMRALSEKLFDGRDFAGLNPSHLPSEEVNDVIQASMNYFPELESAAEALAREAKLVRDDVYRSMVHYLKEKHGIETRFAGAAGDGRAMRRFDLATRTLLLSDLLPLSSRNFQVAHQIALLTQEETFERVIARSHLTTSDSAALCRIALANYFAGALLMPYEDFLASAEAMRYDIELLGHRWGASFEQVCHRLTTLRRPGAEGVPFHFVRVDVAGNISKRFTASGIRFARFSGSCPRWNVHTTFLTPGTIRTQVSRMPDGSTYFCLARTIRKYFGGYGSPETMMAIGLGCPITFAKKLVYADGIDVANLDAAVPIGVSCRLCERVDCEQRAFPPLQHGLRIDENVRALSFYAPPAEKSEEPQ